MKKIMALTVILLLAFSPLCFGAISSSKTKSFSPAPKPGVSTPKTQQSNPNGSTSYQPSAPGSSYKENAPAAQSKTGTSTAAQPAQNSTWRNIGLLGGGMLLGGLLGSMFGFGHLSSLFGVLINIIFAAGIVMGIVYLWNRFRRKQEHKNIR